MTTIINALFGTYPETEQQNTIVQQTTASSECLHTSAVADDVLVKSEIKSETQANAEINTKLNIDALLTQLGTTYAQVDQYSQTRTAEINEQVQNSTGAVLENTQHQQEELLADANRRHLNIDSEYKIQLQKAVETLDAIKAKAIADLEHDLREKRQLIMIEAKKQIDLLNNQANSEKLNVLVQAQKQAKQNLDNLVDQVLTIGKQETETLLQSTTTTIITSQAQTVKTIVIAPVTETVITTSEQQITTTTDNQLQAAIESPTELIPTPTLPTATNTLTEENANVVDIVTAAPDLTTTPVESVPTATPIESAPTTTPIESVLTTTPVESVLTTTPVESVLTTTPIESVLTATPIESVPVSVPADVTPSNNMNETEVKPSQDNIPI